MLRDDLTLENRSYVVLRGESVFQLDLTDLPSTLKVVVVVVVPER